MLNNAYMGVIGKTKPFIFHFHVTNEHNFHLPMLFVAIVVCVALFFCCSYDGCNSTTYQTTHKVTNYLAFQCFQCYGRLKCFSLSPFFLAIIFLFSLNERRVQLHVVSVYIITYFVPLQFNRHFVRLY